MLTIDTGLQPTEWGWKRVDELLVLTMTNSPVAPNELLEVIPCNCKMSSKNTCSTLQCKCRKNELPCSQACGDCRGAFCNNEMPAETDESELIDDGNIFNNLFSWISYWENWSNILILLISEHLYSQLWIFGSHDLISLGYLGTIRFFIAKFRKEI